MKNALGEQFDAMATLYRGYANRLVNWFSRADEDHDVDDLLGSLSSIETEFFDAARVIGDRIEEERRRVSRERGVNMTLWRLAQDANITEFFESASAAVAEVARLRTKALRTVEWIRDETQLESDKLTGARRVIRGYNPPWRQGRNLDGKA